MLIDKDQWHNLKKSFICLRSWTTIRFQKNPKIWKSSKEQKLSIWEILETIIRKIKIIEKSSCKIIRWENSLTLQVEIKKLLMIRISNYFNSILCNKLSKQNLNVVLLVHKNINIAKLRDKKKNKEEKRRSKAFRDKIMEDF